MTAMSTPFDGPLYVALTDINLTENSFDLGDGILLREAYAHLFASAMAAFEPAPPGEPHPPPWKSTTGGYSFDVAAELVVPETVKDNFLDRFFAARTIVVLLKLCSDPAMRLAFFSNTPIAEIAETSDDDVALIPFDTEDRHFQLSAATSDIQNIHINWVKKHWKAADKLRKDNEGFALALDALNRGQYVERESLIMLWIWGALEKLFLDERHELKFRLSAYLAAFLKPAGQERLDKQKEIAKLYDKRSAAAHGSSAHESKDLVQSFNLLRFAVMDIINLGHVPTRHELEERLFGAADGS